MSASCVRADLDLHNNLVHLHLHPEQPRRTVRPPPLHIMTALPAETDQAGRANAPHALCTRKVQVHKRKPQVLNRSTYVLRKNVPPPPPPIERKEDCKFAVAYIIITLNKNMIEVNRDPAANSNVKHSVASTITWHGPQ